VDHTFVFLLRVSASVRFKSLGVIGERTMPMMPALLLGLLGISIPILIHLLHRQKTQPVLWGAMQFLRTSPLQMKQRKKVEHWLLMAMRMLAIAVLAFLLARPRLPQSSFIPKAWTDAPIDVAVILDHSLSTGRMAGDHTVFDRAVATAGILIDQLKSTDTISVILAEHKSRTLNSQPIKKNNSEAIGQLKQQLSQEPQGMTDCSIPEAISAANRLLAGGRHANKAIIVISDQQRSNWHIKDDALWRAAAGEQPYPVYSFPIAPDAEMINVSVSSLNIQPPILGVNRPVQFTAEVVNTGTQPMSALTARLIINGNAIDSKPVIALAPKSSTTIRFDLDTGLSQTGSNRVQISVDAKDALAADNQAVAAANVLEHIPVLVIDGQLSDAGTYKSSQFLQAAMQPQDPSLVQANVVSLSQAVSARLEDYMVVVVNDVPLLPPSLRDRLSDYARSGHGVWIILGPRTEQSTIEKQMNGLFATTQSELMDMSNSPSGLEIKDASNPVVQIVTGDQHNALTGISTRKWWALKPTDSQTILAAGNGDPLIMEHPMGTNGGIIDIWTSSVDGSWNNWNLMPNFVPLVNETIYHLSAASMHGLENHGLEAGQPIEWAGPAKPAVKSVQIILPDHSTVSRTPVFNHGRWLLTYPDTYLPGIYKLQFTPDDVAPVYYGVNIDRSELDPTSLDTDDLNWLKTAKYLDPARPTITAADLPAILRCTGQPPEMWGFLAAALLGCLLVETFITFRLIGSQKRVDVAGAGMIGANPA
jgi:hypothetical protein